MGGDMSYDTRVTVVLLAMLVTGWAFGYAQAYTKYQHRMKDAQERAEAAYRRYWNGYPYDERSEF